MSCEYCGFDSTLEYVRSIELIIPCVWPSQNDVAKNTRGYSGRAYRKFREEYKKLIPQATEAPEFAYVFLTRLFGKRKRRYDVANLIGGGKPLVDALVVNGYLIDDSPKWMNAWYYQERSESGEDMIKIQVKHVRKT